MTKPDPRSFNQWINYKAEWNPAKNKFDKFPFDFSRNCKIDPHDSNNWKTYQEVAASGYPIGFVLTPNDPFGFVDLDDAKHPDGRWTEATNTVYAEFAGAAAEISVSGTGLHIVGVCDPLRTADRRNRVGKAMEFYTQKRFIAFANPVEAWSGDWSRDITDAVLKVVPQRDPNELGGEFTSGARPEYTGPENDDELIQKMLASAGGAAAQFGNSVHVSKLWDADASILCQAFPSSSGDAYDRSAADAALMSHLAFWTGADAARMDRLFQRSALMRPKYRDRLNYREPTIRNAISNCKKVYDRIAPKDAPAQALPTMDGKTFLLLPQQIQFFEGCVYIRDMHRVMIPDGSLLRSEQFNAVYGGYEFAMQADGARPTRVPFEAFTQSRMHQFPKVTTTMFRPNMTPGAVVDNKVNVYFPQHVNRADGDVTPFLDFLARFLPEDRDRAILLAYLAAMTQYIGRKFQWSIVLQGVEGNGKSMILSIIEYALGERYTHRPAAEDLKNPFNSYLENKLAILVDEVHMNGRREILDILKPLITNERVEVQPKGVDKKMIDNVSNWIFATNHKDAVIKTRNDRRYAIMFTAQQDVDDIDRCGMGGRYFPDLWQWLRDGGFARIAHYLKTYPIPDLLNPAGSCHRAPATSSTNASIEASRGRAEQEIVEAIESDRAGFRGGWVSLDAARDLLGEKRIILSPQKAATMLNELGFVKVGRSGIVIMEEAGARPTLFVAKSQYRHGLGADDYRIAQGYGVAPAGRAGNVVRMPGT